MGNATSSQSQDSSRHVFTAQGPVRFSQQVLSSLQESPDTDSSRARTIELQVANKLHSELTKIRDMESQHFAEQDFSLESSSPGSTSDSDRQNGERSHASVKKEIQDLRQKLASRKKIELPSGRVDKVKGELIQCLRTNEKRPLDCWQEVEAFRQAVGELEKAFVDKIVQ